MSDTPYITKYIEGNKKKAVTLYFGTKNWVVIKDGVEKIDIDAVSDETFKHIPKELVFEFDKLEAIFVDIHHSFQYTVCLKDRRKATPHIKREGI